MSARLTDDARVREIHDQVTIALDRMHALGLSDSDLTRAYDHNDIKGMAVEAIFLNVHKVVEEVSNLSFATMREFPDHPWSDIRGMRNRLAHEHFGIDRRTMAEAIGKDLPSLLDFCQEYSDARGIPLDGPVRDGVDIGKFLEEAEKGLRGPDTEPIRRAIQSGSEDRSHEPGKD